MPRLRLEYAFTLLIAWPMAAQPAAPEIEWRALTDSAAEFRAAGRLGEAAQQFESARKLAAQFPAGDFRLPASLNGIGSVQVLRGDYAAAIRTLEEAERLYVPQAGRMPQTLV